MSLSMTDESGQSIEFDKLVKHKENIQPLRQGRSVSQLLQIVDIADQKPTGLSIIQSGEDKIAPDPANSITGTSHQRALKRRIEDSHQHFENLLNTYSRDDIMSVWCDYIDEVQTSTYASSTRALVLPIIESMINHICPTPELIKQYSNDQRFLKNCYLLCESVTDPLRVYRFLQEKGIGQQEAKFYLNYSSLLYINQHYRSTIEVLYNAIKAKVEPTSHLKNRYKYIVECEKQRLSKIMGEPIDDKKFQQLVKAKDQQTIGKFYSFSYDSTRDNILDNDGSSSPTNPDGTIIQRGLSVIYKDGHRPPSPQSKSNTTPNANTTPNTRSPTVNKNNDNSQPTAPAAVAGIGGIYMDSDDEDGHVTDQKAVLLMSPDIKRHSRLATLQGKAKENQQPYTSDFSLAHDTEFIADLDEYNKAKGIHASSIGATTFELSANQITSGIYCDDDE